MRDEMTRTCKLLAVNKLDELTPEHVKLNASV